MDWAGPRPQYWAANQNGLRPLTLLSSAKVRVPGSDWLPPPPVPSDCCWVPDPTVHSLAPPLSLTGLKWKKSMLSPLAPHLSLERLLLHHFSAQALPPTRAITMSSIGAAIIAQSCLVFEPSSAAVRSSPLLHPRAATGADHHWLPYGPAVTAKLFAQAP